MECNQEQGKINVNDEGRKGMDPSLEEEFKSPQYAPQNM